MFLLIGYCSDPTIKHFIAFLENNQNDKFSFIDLDLLLVTNNLKIDYKEDLEVTIDDKYYNFSNYNAIYSRCFFKDAQNVINAWAIPLLLNYLEFSETLVVNKPTAGFDNYSKLLHLINLKQAGLKLPYTFISGCEKVAKSILDVDGNWVSKGASSIRTEAEKIDFSHYLNLDLLQRAPSLFQERISGYDVRVHLVGDEPICLKIESKSLDYRYSQEPNSFQEITLPSTIGEACIEYCKQMKLHFSGIDFKVTDKGEWILLEINPMPGYNYFDKRLDYKISSALLSLLTSCKSKSKHQNKYEVNRPFISAARRRKF